MPTSRQQRTVLLALALVTGSVLVASARPRKTLEECARPLADFCAPELCPTYDERFEEVREEVRGTIDWSSSASAGMCGEWRYVSVEDSCTGTDTYFDASGKLVAAAFHSDTSAFCGNMLLQWYGPPIRCRHEKTRDLRPRRCASMRGRLSELVLVKNAEAGFDLSRQKFFVGLALLAEGDLIIGAPRRVRGAAIANSRVEANAVHAALEPETNADVIALDVPLDCHGERTIMQVTLSGVAQEGRVPLHVDLATSPLAEGSPTDAGTPQ